MRVKQKDTERERKGRKIEEAKESKRKREKGDSIAK